MNIYTTVSLTILLSSPAIYSMESETCSRIEGSNLSVAGCLKKLHTMTQEKVLLSGLEQKNVMHSYANEQYFLKMNDAIKHYGLKAKYPYAMDSLQLIIEFMGQYSSESGETLFKEEELLPYLKFLVEQGVGEAAVALQAASVMGLLETVKLLAPHCQDASVKKVTALMDERTARPIYDSLSAKRHKARVEVTAYLLQHYCV